MLDFLGLSMYNEHVEFELQHTARWSSGQDAALSRRKQGFDSPTSC